MASSYQLIDRLRLRHLRLLELIDTHASLRIVAEHLGLSQPALSQMTRDLENALGTKLVSRSARGVELNAAGRLALQRTRQALTSIEQVATELHLGQASVLRIGINPLLLTIVFPDLVRRLKVDRSSLRIKVVAGNEAVMMAALKDGKIDCYVGVLDWSDMPTNLATVIYHEPLRQSKHVIVCGKSHPLAIKEHLDPAELSNWTWALQPPGSHVRKMIDNALPSAGFQPPIATVEMSSDPFIFLRLAAHTDLLICVPEIAFHHYSGNATLIKLELPSIQFQETTTHFVTLQQNMNLSTIQTFRIVLRDSFNSQFPMTRPKKGGVGNG